MSKRPENLSDIVVVIVGSSSGFGRGDAQELAAKGVSVVIATRTQVHARRRGTSYQSINQRAPVFVYFLSRLFVLFQMSTTRLSAPYGV